MEKTLAPPPTAETTKREKNAEKCGALYSGLAAMEEQGRRGRWQQCLDTLCCFFVYGECAKNDDIVAQKVCAGNTSEIWGFKRASAIYISGTPQKFLRHFKPLSSHPSTPRPS
jgi:hypothetical protein